MSALAAIDALRRTHALLEEAIRRMDAFETDSARDEDAAATVSESLRTAIDTVEAIAGRMLMRTSVESLPPSDLEDEVPLTADQQARIDAAWIAHKAAGPADLEDVEARAEAALPPSVALPVTEVLPARGAPLRCGQCRAPLDAHRMSCSIGGKQGLRLPAVGVLP